MFSTEYVQSELEQQHNWSKIGTYSVTNELFFDLIFTDKCNCRCPFCISCTKEYSKDDFDRWKNSLRQTLNIFDVKSIIILGGEATIDDRFCEKLEYIHSVIKNKRINNVILTTNGIMLRNETILKSIIESDINAVNISYMHYDKQKNDDIFGNNTLSREELKKFHSVLKQHSINMRINVNIYKGNLDSVCEINKFVAYFNGCCDVVKLSPLMKTDMFDTKAEITKYTKKVALNDEYIKTLYESFEKEHKLTNKKDGILGFVRYSEVVADGQNVTLKYAQVEDKYNPDTEIPTLKLYPNGNLSNTWDFKKDILEYKIKKQVFRLIKADI